MGGYVHFLNRISKPKALYFVWLGHVVYSQNEEYKTLLLPEPDCTLTTTQDWVNKRLVKELA